MLIGLAAVGHGGFPAQAPFAQGGPSCLARDDRYTFRWTDSDSPTAFGPAFIDFIATTAPIPTFDVGSMPALGRMLVARDVLEPDVANVFEWRTSTVTSGHYHLWSVVREPPEEVGSVQIVERTPQLVTVVHDGDRVGPSITITRPSSPLAMSSGTFEIRYTACDPTGNARVTLEAGREGVFERIAGDLPAVADGRFEWSTAGLAAGTWTVRAFVHDDCGHVALGYGRYYVDVLSQDAGPRDVSAAPAIDARTGVGARCEETWARDIADAGVPDAAVIVPTPEPDGCQTVTRTTGAAWAVLCLAWHRRRARR